MGPSPDRPQRQLLFVNGFHRSGTTVVASAVTEAVGGVTTTVGVLARHMPAVAALLADDASAGTDRGVDRLAVTPETAEEYGFLLNHDLGTRALFAHARGVPLLRAHVAELAAGAPAATVVLKNPWDVGHEADMLAAFPDAGIILLRRRLADIERSVGQALLRTSSSAYARALEPDDEGHARYQAQIQSPWRRRILVQAYRSALRRRVYRLTRSVRTLPLHRIALVSYDELRTDPEAAARWAGHLVDPEALARAFRRHAFAEQSVHAGSCAAQRALDRSWKGAWDDMRREQIFAGIVAPPWEDAMRHPARDPQRPSRSGRRRSVTSSSWPTAGIGA
jgi:sulfotransferase family protein